MADDDRFRSQGSPFEHEEVFAIAAIPAEAIIDWSDETHAAKETLWLPETLFEALVTHTLVGRLPRNKQNRLGRTEYQQFAAELRVKESLDGDVGVAAALVAEIIARAKAAQGHVLLVEGP